MILLKVSICINDTAVSIQLCFLFMQKRRMSYRQQSRLCSYGKKCRIITIFVLLLLLEFSDMYRIINMLALIEKISN